MKKIGLTSSKSARVFKPKDAKGGCELDTSKTALVLIEYQSLRSAANFRRARSRLGSRIKKKIETVVLSGFLTNCCVESTMRTAYEKGT